MTTRTPQTSPERKQDNRQSEQKEQVSPDPAVDLFAGKTHQDPRSMSTKQILQLQRTIGNRAVSSLLTESHSTPPSPGSTTIQRKLIGDLSKKSANEIIRALKDAGYIVPTEISFGKVNREIINSKQEFETIDAIAGTLGLQKEVKPQETVKEEEKPKSELGNAGLEGDLKGLYYTQVMDRLEVIGYQVSTVKKVTLLETLKVKIQEGKTYSDFHEIAKDLALERKGVSAQGGFPTTWEQNTDKESGGPESSAASATSKPYSGFGKLANLTYKFENGLLSMTAEVIGKYDLIWKAGDLIAVELQLPTGRYHTGNIRIEKTSEAQTTGNSVTVSITYTYARLVRLVEKAMGIPYTGQENADDMLDFISTNCQQMGLLITWRTEDGKGEQHRSGGIEARHGYGTINAKPLTLTDLKKTEDVGVRNTGWNESETLEQSGRKDTGSINTKFPNLVRLDKEIATTLEAESEYIISKEQYAQIIQAMQTLTGTGKEDLLKQYGIVKEVDMEKKVYIDTYFDLDVGDDSNPLLDRNIVFRRRSVPKDRNNGKGDPEGTMLIAVKGSSYRKQGKEEESIRLASQFEAKYNLLDEDQQQEVLNFLKSQDIDNPFARTMQDALGYKPEDNENPLNQAQKLKESITVESERTKYKLWLEHGTMIDLSVDEAKATRLNGQTVTVENVEDQIVRSFEFGVGHPGLATSSAGGSGLSEQHTHKSAPKSSNQVLYDQQMKNYRQQVGNLVHRPYHVPQDLRNESLFKKDDYIQYMNLRDVLISKLFQMDKTELTRGGNKARLLAQNLKR